MIEYSVQGETAMEPVGRPPFHFFASPEGGIWAEFFRDESGYLIRFPEMADFRVSGDGSRVEAYPVPELDAFTLEHLYINQVMPLALSRQGRPTFHASVVTVPGGAVAFLGRSGMGKSTLAAWFARHGAAFLTDDGLVVEETGGGVMALPSHPSVRLWDDSIDGVMDGHATKAPSLPFTTKSRLLADADLSHTTTPQPLLAAFVLTDQAPDAVNLYAMAGVDRVMGWLAHSFLLDVEDNRLIAQHFEWTLRVSGRVPTYSLDYPRRYDMLQRVRDAVLATLS